MSDTAVATVNAAPPPAPTPRGAWHNPDGFSFRDIIDVINPLQHIPIVNSIYRWLTGDRPGEAAQIAGDALYGGPIGVGISLVSALAEDSQGHNLGERVLAAVFGPNDKSTAVAAETPPASRATAPQAAMAPAAPPAQQAALALPARAPMQLYGGMTLLPSGPSAPPTQATAAHDLLAHNAAMERQLSTGPRPMTANAPVPLVLPAGSMPLPRLTLPAAPAAPPPATSAAASAGAGAIIPASPGAPVNISQKMMDALDKYMKLEQDRKAGKDGATSPGVDLSL